MLEKDEFNVVEIYLLNMFEKDWQSVLEWYAFSVDCYSLSVLH